MNLVGRNSSFVELLVDSYLYSDAAMRFIEGKGDEEESLYEMGARNAQHGRNINTAVYDSFGEEVYAPCYEGLLGAHQRRKAGKGRRRRDLKREKRERKLPPYVLSHMYCRYDKPETSANEERRELVDGLCEFNAERIFAEEEAKREEEEARVEENRKKAERVQRIKDAGFEAGIRNINSLIAAQNGCDPSYLEGFLAGISSVVLTAIASAEDN